MSVDILWGRRVSGRIVEGALIVASRDVMSCDLSGGAALLDTRTGTYHGLNEVGAEVWRYIAQEKKFEDIRDHVLERFSVDSDRCGRDLVALVNKLAAAQLVEIVDAESLQISGAGTPG